NVTGVDPIAAFPTQVNSGSCAQAVGASGYIESSCAFFAGLSPQQPSVVPLGGGYAGAAIATTTACSMGQLAIQVIAPSAGGNTQSDDCASGSALPSIAPLPDGESALVTWYETPLSTRGDSLQSCAGASAAPLVAAVVSGATSASPTLGKPVTLTSAGVSVRAAAMAALPGLSQVLVAAPDGDAVSVWALDASLSASSPVSVPGLAGARAVSMAVATDGSGRVALAAEIGCTPQTIALVGGTLSGGFSEAIVVAGANGAAAVQPTVAWVASEGDWVVAWISADGGAHVLAQRFDAGGVARGGVIDPSTPATGASVDGDGSLLEYVPASNSFVKASLGCAE
ncbi:MAG TPA: hypothetical protein VHS09_00425, partial [Polyangiaceae bacterium]|nr:hypothetical protein [Polyangiaceae bacterium]